MNGSNSNHPHEALSAYLDGELEPAERAALQEHLGRCPECSQLVEDLRTLADAVGRESVPPVPADLIDRIAARLETEGTSRRAAPPERRWRYRAPLAAAASLAAATLLYLFWQGPPAERQQTPDSGPAEARETPSVAAPPAPGLPQGSTTDGSRVRGDGAKDAPSPGRGPVNKDDAGVDATPAAPPAGMRAGKPKQKGPGIAPAVPGGQPAITHGNVGVVGKQVAAEAAEQRQEASLKSGLARNSTSVEKSGRVGETMSLLSPGRTLLLEAPGYSISLSEGGAMTVRVREYRCTVLPQVAPPPPDTASLRDAPSAAQDSAGGAPNAEVASIFRFVTSPNDAEYRLGPPPAPVADAAVPVSSVFLLTPTGDRSPVAPREGLSDAESRELLRVLSARIRSLVRQSYRTRLEQACGPLPPPFDTSE